MNPTNKLKNGIPISPSLSPTLENENKGSKKKGAKKRLLRISVISFVIAVAISFIAKFLILLINFITNISFHGTFSTQYVSPATNSIGLWVIIVPTIGGLIVGLMAIYGSKAIRGHGIPEAMEQILINQSKIKPTITYLKPLSSAIAIGTGGPFGAEGPIIATGGALGSTLGQILNISHNERKILLAAGATAGMAAIFGTPIAGIFLAIELLLFEFSTRSLLPVAIACIVGAAGHHLLFGHDPVFAMGTISSPTNLALIFYGAMGIVIGLLSVGVSKMLHYIELGFEKLPIHWAWGPAIGGLFVGLIGYFSPRTLGVGYENITDLLSGSLTLQVILSLCFLKLASWAVALGSGTSGGTLAPLLTIGGAAGILIGMAIQFVFPNSGITIPLASLVGMAAMFAGASRALLTSVIFALEATFQPYAMLPLLVACVASYFISFLLMENTIMTEKIARRGVRTPESFEPDALESIIVEQALHDDGIIISEENSIQEVRDWLHKNNDYKSSYFIVSDNTGAYKGILNSLNLFNNNHPPEDLVGTLIKSDHIYINTTDTLRLAVETMAKENIDILPVISKGVKGVVGILTIHNIIATYKHGADEHEKKRAHISLKRTRLKMLIGGKKLVSTIRRNEK